MNMDTARSPIDGPLDANTLPAALSEGTFVFREDPINILILDDEPKNLTVLETILSDRGYRLVRSETADQALLALVGTEFALLILDISMPGMNGFELARMIKERKKTAHVPIIFLTAYYNDDHHVLEGYGTGAVDYLHKPVNPLILRSKVAVFVDLYRKNREIESANRALFAEVSERRRVEERLRELNDHLEQRVSERTEALKESDRRKDEFLATLAHELRNPLAPVRNAVQVLHLKSPSTPELKFAKEVIERQMRSLTQLIDGLMDLSRINRGRIELKKGKIELAQVFQEAIEASRPLVEDKGHELVVKVSAEPILLNGDLTRLAQVFLNLLNNAAKFTGTGGRIELSAQRHGREVVVSVKDNGIGISTAHQQSVFQMFSQVEGALSGSQGGLGIGLSLVKQFVELHGGRVEVKSAGSNMGSEFLVRLPVITEMSRGSIVKNEEDAPALPASQLNVLVVDDNRDAAFSLTMLIEMTGNTVSMVHDGEKAVEAAGKNRPDVVLCDIGLPKMSGYDVARAIRRESWGKNIFLVAVTGWGKDEDKRKSEAAGFDHHMVKPVDPQLIMRLLGDLKPGKK